jgi:DNA-binding transcriptional MocR family regulator
LGLLAEPDKHQRPDPAQFVGIHARVSQFVTHRRNQVFSFNFSNARCAPGLYPTQELKLAAQRSLRIQADMFAMPCSARGAMPSRQMLAARALRSVMRLAPEVVRVTNGCIGALNIALRAVARLGDTVAVQSPTFYGLLQVLQSLGMRAVEIPTSLVTGISVEALEFALRAYPNVNAVVV